MAATKSVTKKKASRTNSNRTYMYGLYAVGLLVAAYGFASWAIDSGSILAHIGAFASIYAAFRFIIMIFRKQ